jgi:hypothetical protein
LVLVMVLAGAQWLPASRRPWALPLVCLAVRVVARRFWTLWAAALLLPTPARAARLGNGLLAQGTMAVALGVHFAQRFPASAPAVLTAVLLCMIVSDPWRACASRVVLLDAAETIGIGVAPLIALIRDGVIMRRPVVLPVLLAAMFGITAPKTDQGGVCDPLTFAAIGFVALAAFTVPDVGSVLQLPRVTCYVLACVALGPSAANHDMLHRSAREPSHSGHGIIARLASVLV